MEISLASRVPAEDRSFAIAIGKLPGVGPRRSRLLAAAAGSYKAAWAHLGESWAAAGLPPSLAPPAVAAQPAICPAECVEQLRRQGIGAVFEGDQGYPRGFGAMHDAPVVVYIRGGLTGGDAVACSVVGTRQASPYGRWITTKIVAGLARAGVTVVSGLAHGIDGCAHAAALAAGGRTLAVLAGGLDRVYPADHEALAGQVERSGALLSEYLPGSPTRAGNFAARNRLIAALGLVTLVCEAGRRSGAMITARFAAEYGRDVLAVPGRVGDPGATGVNDLIRDGAGLVQSAQDVLVALGLDGAHRELAAADVPGLTLAGAGAGPGGSLDGQLVALLGLGPRSESQLIEACGAEASRVRACLTMLELQGRVSRWPGGVYSVRES